MSSDEIRLRRLAENESVFREVNERIEESAERFRITTQARFVCECADPSCTQSIELTLTEYEAVRAGPARFALKSGHEEPDIERVVEEHDRYLVVEKMEGPGRDRAAELDPRS